MKTLVSGADGLLGSNLVRRLLERDFDVRVLIHPLSASKTLDGLPIERRMGDILDISFVEEAVKGCEVVFHAAASTAFWPPRDPKIVAVNLEGTHNMLKAAVRYGVRRFIHVGSASSFGYGTKEQPGTEETPYCYQNLKLAYFESKLKAQELVLRHVKEGKMEAVVVSPTFMFGPYDSGPSSGRIIVKFAQLKPSFYPPGGRCFIHARDVADGMILALEKGRSGECYILGNWNMEMRELLEILSRIVGIKAPHIKVPAPLVVFAGRIGSMVASVTGKPVDLTYEIAKNSCEGTYYSAAKAVRELGLPQTPIENALEEAYRWLRDNGKIRLK